MWKKWSVFAAAVIIACVIYARCHRIEGMTNGNNPEVAEKTIQTDSQQMRDNINLQDYRKNYEEIILETETWAQRKRLNLLTQPFTTDPKLITQFNDLSSFIVNLNSALTWADKN